jgi:hypothetical protein
VKDIPILVNAPETVVSAPRSWQGSSQFRDLIAATEYYGSYFCLLCINGSCAAGLVFILGTDVGRHLLYSIGWVLCLIFKDLCVCPNIMLAIVQGSPPKVDGSVPRCRNSTSRPIDQG